MDRGEEHHLLKGRRILPLKALLTLRFLRLIEKLGHFFMSLSFSFLFSGDPQAIDWTLCIICSYVRYNALHVSIMTLHPSMSILLVRDLLRLQSRRSKITVQAAQLSNYHRLFASSARGHVIDSAFPPRTLPRCSQKERKNSQQMMI